MEAFLTRWFPRLLALIWSAITTFAKQALPDIYTAIEISTEIRTQLTATAEEVLIWFDARTELHRKAILYALRVNDAADVPGAIAELSTHPTDGAALLLARRAFVSLTATDLPDHIADLLIQVVYSRQKHEASKAA